MGERALRKPLAVATVMGAALVLVAFAVGLWPTTSVNRGQARAAVGEAQIQATLELFRRERTGRDEMPGDPVGALKQTGDAQPGEDPSLARRVEVVDSRRSAWVWPMTDGVCYSAPEGGGGCVPIDRIRDHGVAVAVNSAIRRSDLTYRYARVFGIARDGIGAVTLKFADGREVSSEVRDNLFFADLADMPAEVRWEDSQGSHVEPIWGGVDSLEPFRSP